MNRRFAALAGIVLIAASAVAATHTPTQPSADIARGEGCIFFDANGTPWLDADARVQIVTTNNGRGNRNAYCQGSLPAGAALPTEAQHFDNSNTGYISLAGDDWKMTVSPSGRASFTCHVPI